MDCKFDDGFIKKSELDLDKKRCSKKSLKSFYESY